MEAEQTLVPSFNRETLNATTTDRGFDSLKDGEAFYKILPPFGTNHGGALWKYTAVHWVEIKTQGGTTKVPVGCPYRSEKFCPDCEVAWAAQDGQEGLDRNSDEWKQLEAVRFKHAADVGFIANALNKAGQVRKLKLKPSLITGKRGDSTGADKSRPEGKLVRKINEALDDYKIDPTSLTAGLWLKFTRLGKGFATEYDVDFQQTTANVNGRIVKETVPTSVAVEFPELYTAIVEQYKNGGAGPLFDIHSLYDQVSALELKQIRETQTLPERLRRKTPAQIQSFEVTAQPAPLAPLTPVVTQAAPTVDVVQAAKQAAVVAAIASVPGATAALGAETVAKAVAAVPATPAPVAPAVDVTAKAKAEESINRLKAMGLIK